MKQLSFIALTILIGCSSPALVPPPQPNLYNTWNLMEASILGQDITEDWEGFQITFHENGFYESRGSNDLAIFRIEGKYSFSSDYKTLIIDGNEDHPVEIVEVSANILILDAEECPKSGGSGSGSTSVIQMEFMH